MTPWTYILSSAAIYAASFLFISNFWWGIFFFLVPLFYLLQIKHLNFFHGFVWGIVTYGFHLSAIGAVTLEYGKGPLRFIAPLFVLVWFALWSGLWFVGLSSTRNYSPYLKIVLQLFITYIFFFFIHYSVLFPFFGEIQGYPFVFPLIPLMYGNLLKWLPIAGSSVILTILIGLQLAVTYQYRSISAVLLVLFFLDVVPHKKQEWQKPFKAFACIWQHETPYERAQEICHALIEVQYKYPEKRVFVLPESSFPYPLHEHSYALKMWNDHMLFKNSYLILGSYRREGGKLFNTFYIIYQGRIIFYYDKRHMIPFFEKRISSIILKLGNDLFLSTKESFTKNSSPEKTFVLGSSTFTEITPMLCSEAFWEMPQGKNIVVLVNDSYFAFSYFPKLMKILAQLNALENEIDLFYCSYRSNLLKKN